MLKQNKRQKTYSVYVLHYLDIKFGKYQILDIMLKQFVEIDLKLIDSQDREKVILKKNY